MANVGAGRQLLLSELLLPATQHDLVAEANSRCSALRDHLRAGRHLFHLRTACAAIALGAEQDEIAEVIILTARHSPAGSVMDPPRQPHVTTTAGASAARTLDDDSPNCEGWSQELCNALGRDSHPLGDCQMR